MTEDFLHKNLAILSRFNTEKIHFDEGNDLESFEQTKTWFWKIPFIDEKETCIVLGLGSAFLYDVASEWLRQNPKRLLIVFERTLSKRFLSSKKAYHMLSDSQVIVKVLPLDWSKAYASIAQCMELVFGSSYLIASQKIHPEFALRMHSLIETSISDLERYFAELHVGSQEIVASNVYRNFLCLDRAYDAKALEGAFKGIPALICGAGPSIEAQIADIAKVQNKTLIFAAGSAMNVLAAGGVIPHFGAGVDPQDVSCDRILMSEGFDVPYFFRCRFNHDALHWLSGVKIWCAGKESVPIGRFLERKALLQGALISARVSTTHFIASIAAFLGCSPIILTGLDLSYTEKKRYAKGVTASPIPHRKEH